MSRGIQYLLVASAAILLLATVASGKTIGVKDSNDDESLLKKTPEDFLNIPEYGTEAALATALLAQDYQDSLKEQQQEQEQDAETEKELEKLEELELELEQAATETSTTHHRSKRTIGFLTRLGACVMTFMSNPTCWTRLTRGQIQREEQRQLQLLQQEQEKQLLEQQIYESYANNLLNGTTAEGVNGTSNGNTTTTSKKRQRTKLTTTTTTTTPRPKLFPMMGRVTQGLARLFPRLFGFLNPGGIDSSSSSPSLISQFTSARSSQSTPQFRINALQ